MKRLWRLVLVVTVLAALAAGCSNDGDGSAEGGEAAPTTLAADAKPAEPTDAQIQINWFPEAEFGGFYYAQINGLYEDWNVDMEILPGGPGVNPVTVVASGRAKFGVANGDQLLVGRGQGVPVVALMAVFQKYPQAIMVHEESGIQSFADIAARGTKVAVARNNAYVPYLLKKFGWKEEQLIEYNGQLGTWLNDKSLATQVFITSEPYPARQAGAHPRVLLIADQSGFNPYARVLFTTEEVIREEPELVNAVVAASLAGWRRYMEDPEETHAHIMALAPDETEDALRYTWESMKDLVFTGEAAERGLGVMTGERWQQLVGQMQEVGFLQTDVNADEVWTDRFFSLHLQPPR
ncbi:MAG TPA: ABC transporter substrate-binding protein [Dehalococcoidia bacterium]